MYLNQRHCVSKIYISSAARKTRIELGPIHRQWVEENRGERAFMKRSERTTVRVSTDDQTAVFLIRHKRPNWLV